MKVHIPEHEVEACDCCERTGLYLRECKACGRDHCMTCRAMITGCVHQVDVCRRCGETAEIQAAVARFVDPLQEVLAERDAAIVRAGEGFAWKLADRPASQEAPR